MTKDLKLTPYSWYQEGEVFEINVKDMEAFSSTNVFSFSINAKIENSICEGDYFNAPEINNSEVFAEVEDFCVFDLMDNEIQITEEQKNEVIKEIISLIY